MTAHVVQGAPQADPAERASIESAASWWIAAVALVMASLSFGAISAVPVLLKPLAAEWGVGASPISLVHTSGMLGAALGGLVLGRVLDRYGFFPIGIAAAGSTGVGLLIASHAHSLVLLHIAFGVLVGAVGQGGLFSALSAAVAQWFDRRRGLAIAIVASGQSVGGLLLPPLLRWGAHEAGWRETLWLFGVICLFVIGGCALAFRRSPPRVLVHTQDPEDAMPYAPLTRSMFLAVGLCMSLFNYAAFVAVGHLTALGEERGFAPTAAATLVSALLGIALVSRLAIGPLARRWGTYRALLAAAGLHTFGVICLSVAQGYAQIALSAMVLGLGFGGYLPAFAILVRERCEAAQAGRRMAEIFFFGFSAGGAGSVTAGLLRDATGGYGVPLAVGACSAAMGLALLTALRRRLGAARDTNGT